MSMYNLIEYSDNYLKAFGSLWQCYKNKPTLDDNNNITNFPGNSVSFKSKVKIT